jgi:hypothetical protein
MTIMKGRSRADVLAWLESRAKKCGAQRSLDPCPNAVSRVLGGGQTDRRTATTCRIGLCWVVLSLLFVCPFAECLSDSVQPATNSSIDALCASRIDLLSLTNLTYECRSVIRTGMAVEITCQVRGDCGWLRHRMLTNAYDVTSIDGGAQSWDEAVITYELVCNSSGFYQRYPNATFSRLGKLEEERAKRVMWQYLGDDAATRSVADAKSKFQRLPFTVCAYKNFPSSLRGDGNIRFEYMNGTNRVACEATYDANTGIIKSYVERAGRSTRCVTTVDTGAAVPLGNVCSIDGRLVKASSLIKLPEGVGGVGVLLDMMSGADFMTVVGLVAGSSAENAGVEKGDRLIAVDDAKIEGLPGMEVLKLLRGPPESSVNATFSRQGMNYSVTLARKVWDRESSGAGVTPAN